MKKEIDKTKKSNIKCEHCGFWNTKENSCNNYYCNCEDSPKYNTQTNYWNRCKNFIWK